VTTPDSTSFGPDAIAFVGGGNMARSLVAGLRASGTPAHAIHVAEPVQSLRDGLRADFGVDVFERAADAVAPASTWVLAAKPQALRGICEDLAPIASTVRPLVISIAAGIGVAQLQRWLGDGIAIVRAMPNTPALLGAGVTGLFATPDVTADGRLAAERLLATAGRVVWLDDEAQMDAVTAVSGSGPAYVFLLAEAMLDAAQAQGLPEDASRTLVLQTILGAARMLDESDAAPAELRARVTSPGGTTQAAIDAFEQGGLRALVAHAIDAARRRAQQLSLDHG
jgi:pyrroline-5-carboxylate reductase